MKFCLFLFTFNLTVYSLFAQSFRVLHYSETSGYDHQTRSVSLSMFQDIALANNFLVDDDLTGDAFNSLSNLEQYALVVFSNTSGDAILDANQRANFEAYINDGGSYLGIHAASDTYRHSSANGANTGAWDFYAELVGASVQQNPNHVSGTPQYQMNHIGSHPTTVNLPNPWIKNEEYYYWETGYFGSNNNPVLEVEETIGPNNMVNSYDAIRPMSWYRELSSGGRMFYTALGHSTSNFTSDQDFVQHITDAILWIADITTEIQEAPTNESLRIVRFGYQLLITVDGKTPQRTALYTILGKEFAKGNTSSINVEELPKGVYLLKALLNDQVYFRKIYIGSPNL